MPERPGFELSQIDGRSMVRLRVRPQGAAAAGKALQLPRDVLRWQGEDPAAYWLGPDQWLLTSDTKAADVIISHIDATLSGQLHAAIDMSSNNVCFALSGPAARTVLAMGCGIDMHESAFTMGQCVQTNFANVLLFIVALEDNRFDLYVDRSHRHYLNEWIIRSGEDIMTSWRRYSAGQRQSESF